MRKLHIHMLYQISSYLVHDIIVGFSQDHWHVLSCHGVFEVAWVLTILIFTQDFSGLFRFLNIKRTNGDPSKTLKPFQISLVNSLRAYVERIPVSNSTAYSSVSW